MRKTAMKGVIEYCEHYDVELVEQEAVVTIKALNESGYNSTEIDLRGLLVWLKTHRPELLDI